MAANSNAMQDEMSAGTGQSEILDAFVRRHIGPAGAEQSAMLKALGFERLDQLIDTVVPEAIRDRRPLALEAPASEVEALALLQRLAQQNQPLRSFIGQGYYGTHMPAVIQRNILESPAWYTAYTPYQPEISQGRLEALLNFQTMITDLTGMELANASMLDESSAAAEAMLMCHRCSRSNSNRFFVDRDCMPQTLDVLAVRAQPLGIELVVADVDAIDADADFFGGLLAYPGASGEVRDIASAIKHLQGDQGLVAVSADLLSLVLLQAPGELGADIVLGSSQRFGVPMGYGGPHAAFFATRDKYRRSLPGRLVGVSVDSQGGRAFRLALQTREQHIRREKATSNICTAQVLLAVIAGFYALFHGPRGLTQIASRVHGLTNRLAAALSQAGLAPVNSTWFDTLTLACGDQTEAIHQRALGVGINLRRIDHQHIGIAFDETHSEADVAVLYQVITGQALPSSGQGSDLAGLPSALTRRGAVLQHALFESYRSETDLLRYMRLLADKDLALDRTMIPLGSCTMKLNATSEMIPIGWPQFANLHPFAPADQASGYITMMRQLEAWLCEMTGYHAVSLQPNAGSQGEYAGLLAIRAYHRSRGDKQRDICLIPASAHGTNPASAQLCGMQVAVVACRNDGQIDIDDLRRKVEASGDRLAAIMITYPSTYGVFEDSVREVCEIIHQHGGQVYIDGANLNAMVGLCKPAHFGGDVSHLNLHKTFCIPHGGGGPGVGPVAVAEHLAPFLPGHRYLEGSDASTAVTAAPWGSASILPISWMYIRMMGPQGLTSASEIAILNANYIAQRLAQHYRLHFTDANGYVAHECVIDIRGIEQRVGITAEDIAKRLIDYGFHAPTMSFPVAGTLMIEPTESESKQELDRFIEAMIAIRQEIDAVEQGRWPADDNPLVNAPHTSQMVCADEWRHAYTREQAAYPIARLRAQKYWVPVARVDNVYGDRNLACACPPMESYASELVADE